MEDQLLELLIGLPTGAGIFYLLIWRIAPFIKDALALRIDAARQGRLDTREDMRQAFEQLERVVSDRSQRLDAVEARLESVRASYESLQASFFELKVKYDALVIQYDALVAESQRAKSEYESKVAMLEADLKKYQRVLLESNATRKAATAAGLDEDFGAG